LAEENVTETKSGVLALDLGTAIRMLINFIERKLGKWMGGKVVTLDIDSTSIRLLEIKGGVVRRWADTSFEPVEIEGEETPIQPDLGMVVKQLMDSSGIKANKVIASLSGLYSVSRIVSESNLPPASTTEEAIREIAREIIPLSLDKQYLSSQTISSKEGERLFLAVSVAKEVMDNEVRSLKAVGIHPQAVELKTMALTRVVNKEQALILNIEPSSFDIVVVVNGMPEVMRTIAWRQDNLTEEDAVEHLATNLEMTVDFYNSHHLEKPLDPDMPLFITGQLFNSAAPVEKLKVRIEYPFESLAPPLECPPFLPVSQYAVNIGLALRKAISFEDYERDGRLPLYVNLLPEIYQPWRPTAKLLYSGVVILAALALLFPLFQVTSETMSKTASLQSKFDILNNQLTLKQVEIKKREPLQRAIGEYKTIFKMGGNFTEDLVVIMKEAEALSITVDSVIHEGSSIDVTCQAEDYVTFRKYLTALEESGRFATPIPPPEGYPYTTGGPITLEPAAPGPETSE